MSAEGAAAGLARLNALAPEAAAAELERCCGSGRWVRAMLARRPFASEEALYEAGREAWEGLSREDFLEAFSHHPRIGDREALRERFASTAAWARGEQAGAVSASEDVLERLALENRAYEARFGHIFIVCASGKSAAEMLALLRARLANEPEAELRIAAAEQAKITRLRLEKLLRGT
jgi:2-oxo-4-hydroxy-4-carboxy-5-ureidoimidazoline decarboxylase